MTKKKQKSTIVTRTKHLVRIAIVPHKSNNYRPHLIRRYGLVAIFFVIVGLQLGFNAVGTGNVLGRETTITIGSLLDETNTSRTDNKQPPLILNEKLTKAAYLKAQDILAHQYWAHTSPDGTQPWKWLADVKYDYAEAGENLAKNFTSSNAVIGAWLASPDHRANVLKAEYRDVGFAVVDGELNGKQTSLVVALYGLPAEEAVAGVSTTFIAPPTNSKISLLSKLGLVIQSMNPGTLGSVVLIGIATVVAFAAHAYRQKLPKALRQSWYRHHGLYKAAGMISFGAIILLLSGTGQL